jgi:hypothetical protein
VRRRILPVWPSGLQCRILHPLLGVVLMTAGSPAKPAEGVDTRALQPGWEAPLTVESRVRFARQLSAQIVEVRRSEGGPMIGGALPRLAGWHASTARVVTAAWAVLGWPKGDVDHIEVRVAGGPWLAAAVGLVDLRIGYAVLDVPGLPKPAVPVSSRAPATNAVSPAVTLYSAHGQRLVPVPIAKQGTGQRAYYFHSIGAPLPLGMPLFDTRGGFVSLIGLASDVPTEGGFVLPAGATQLLFVRALDWRVSQ